MGRMMATTVYLDAEQKRGLNRLAKVKGSHFSQEIRAAIQEHLAFHEGPAEVTPEALAHLAREAHQCIGRMLRRLGDTNRQLDAVLRTVARSNRRALGGR